MKVLLLGDFSTFHVNLAHGLRSLGVEVDLFSTGDGWKETDCTKMIPKDRMQRLSFYNNLAKNIDQYDIVQLMGDAAIAGRLSIIFWFLSLIKNGTSIYLMAAGCDYHFWTQGRKKLNMPLFDEVEKNHENKADRFSDWARNALVLKYVDGIIGFNEYFETYKSHKKCLSPVIPPVPLDRIDFVPMDWKKKPLIVLHGMQSHRKGFKGSLYVEKAFEILNERYPNELQCICAGDMPYSQYVEIVTKSHILVDQTNSISYGMNSLLGMAMGKVVCSASQDKKYYDRWLPLMNIMECPPITPLAPNVDYIVSQIENLLLNREKLEAISINSRVYVEKYHDAKKVAQMFLDRWNASGNAKHLVKF